MIELVVIRGGGDIASGVIQKLKRAGFNLLVTEIKNPSFIRRSVSYGSAQYSNNFEFTLEDVTSKYIGDIKEKAKEGLENEVLQCIKENKVPILTDSELEILNILKSGNKNKFKVLAVIDAIIAKKNLGMNMEKAPITIGLGPGFIAGEDVDIVIETMRGHDLGRLIFTGSAKKNTGIPGMVGGESKLRVIHSPVGGIFKVITDIGSIVKKGDKIGYIGELEIVAPIDGLIRGIIKDGYNVIKGMKIGDIDPREEEYKNAFTISDKARSLGGAVLEGVLFLKKEKLMI